MSRLKHLLRLQYGSALAADTREEGKYSVYGSNGAVGTHVVRNTKAPAIIVGRKGSCGKVTWAENGGFCIDTAYFLDDRHCAGDLRFSYYALLHLKLDEQSKESAVPSLDRNDAHNRNINLPDLATQRQIADFLDRETARIDLLIEKKQKLVALLGEKYEATAALLSTGKQSHASMVHSGLDWLGSIPESWRVEKLSWHFYAAKGKDAQKYTKEYCGANEGQFPVYSGQTADEGVMGWINTFDYDFGETGVLFATTVGAKAMHLRHLQGKFSLSQNCMIIIPWKNLPLRFFLYQMRVLFRKERQMIPDHMQASFRVDDLYQYRIAVPPLNEAMEIGLAIEKAEAAWMAVSQPVYSSIDRLKEYRSTLITAAVTGQIDVTTCAKSGATDRRLDAIEEQIFA